MVWSGSRRRSGCRDRDPVRALASGSGRQVRSGVDAGVRRVCGVIGTQYDSRICGEHARGWDGRLLGGRRQRALRRGLRLESTRQHDQHRNAINPARHDTSGNPIRRQYVGISMRFYRVDRVFSGENGWRRRAAALPAARAIAASSRYLPVMTKWPRRFWDQQASPESRQNGTSLPRLRS